MISRWLPHTKSWSLRLVVVAATLFDVSLGTAHLAGRWGTAEQVTGIVILLALSFVGVATWRLRFWALGLNLGVVGMAMTISVIGFFPMYGFDVHPGPTVELQLVRWLAFEAVCAAVIAVGLRHQDELVRSF